jgi:integrase/recombinase XerC
MAAGGEAAALKPALEPDLAEVVSLQRRKAAEVSDGDEQSFFLDTLAEYQWARDAAAWPPQRWTG